MSKKLPKFAPLTLDKILFVFKNVHKLRKAPKSFKERELKDIFNIAEISNFTESELYRYEAIMRNEYDQRACLAYAKKEGREEGKKEGLVQGVLQTAKNMLKDGLKPERVARITKLPKEQIIAFSKA